MADLELRVARPKDTALVLEILNRAARWIHDDLGVHDQWPREFPPDFAAPALDHGFVRLVVVGGDVAGTVRVHRDDPAVWGPDDGCALYVHGLAIDRRHGGVGLGGHVLDAVQREGVAIERPIVRLDCVAANDRLRAYYRDLGFEHRGDVEQQSEHATWCAARFERLP